LVTELRKYLKQRENVSCVGPGFEISSPKNGPPEWRSYIYTNVKMTEGH
jgi:hypothetical protein